MRLLKVSSSNFKKCDKDITLSFIPVGNKYEVDKEFELNLIDDNLYTFSTVGIVGKNATGKTTIIELLSVVYDILSSFHVGSSLSKRIVKYIDSSFNLDIVFYHEGFLYRYITSIEKNKDLVNADSFIFSNEKLYVKKYSKTNASKIFAFDEYEILKSFENYAKPEDTSILFSLLGKQGVYALNYSPSVYDELNYNFAFELYKMMDDNYRLLDSVLNMFDENISSLRMMSNDKFEIKFKNSPVKTVSSLELHEILSSGTSKGFVLMSSAVFALRTGCDLLVDEIENHFHRTLVENLVNLFKDKEVNKRNATLIFTTHFGELLDQFSRYDNIYVTSNNGKIQLKNAYQNFDVRKELLKSKRYYGNAFGTNVDYDSLMKFKKELMLDE